MIDTSAPALLELAKRAETHVQSLLPAYHDRVRRCFGPTAQGEPMSERLRPYYDPENHLFEYVSLMVPRLVGEAALSEVTSAPGPESSMVATAMQFAMDRWLLDTEHLALRAKLAVPYCLGWTTALTTVQPVPGTTDFQDPRLMPQVTALGAGQHFWDPDSPGLETARFQGHRIVRDRKELLRTAERQGKRGWDLDAIRKLPAVESRLEAQGRPPVPGYERRGREQDLVAYRQIWVPGAKLENEKGAEAGFNGVLFTIGAGARLGEDGVDPMMLRPPEPYSGPRWGPYTMFSCHVLPDQATPVAPTAPTEGQVQELNDLVRAANASDRRYKRIILVDSGHKKLASIIKTGKHDYVFSVNGLGDGMVQVVELGGSTVTQQQAIAIARDRVDRITGISEAMRGQASGGATATADTIAAESGEVRVGWVLGRFETAESKMLRTVAWHIYHNDSIAIPLGREAETTLGIEDPWFVGKPDDGFDQMQVRVRALPQGAAREARLQMLNMVPAVAPVMVQTPWVQWDKWAAAMSEASGQRDFREMFDWEALAEVSQMALEDPSTFGEAPRFSQDLGKAGAQRRQVRATGGPKGGPPAVPAPQKPAQPMKLLTGGGSSSKNGAATTRTTA